MLPQASALGVKLPQFPPVPHAVHSVSRDQLVHQQNLQPPSVSLSQKLTERVEHWFGRSGNLYGYYLKLLCTCTRTCHIGSVDRFSRSVVEGSQ